MVQMKNLILLVAGIVLALLAVFVIAAHGGAIDAPALQSPTNGQNVSNTTGYLLLNATFDTVDNNVNLSIINVTFHFQNASGAFVYNTTIFNTTHNTTQFLNRTFDTKTFLADGNYNITLSAVNGTYASNQSFVLNSTYFNITVDNTPPNVTVNLVNANNTIQYGSNFTATTNNRTFNTSVFDGLTLVDTVYFWFDNGTGADFNITGTNNSGQWSVSYNVSAMAEEKQGVRIVANDTVNNVNSSFFFNFTVDRTSPNVTINYNFADNNNFSIRSNNQTFNASVFDNLTLVDTVYFWFDNGTGADVNITGTNRSGQWSVSYNVSALAEGKQGVRIVANDTVNNVNSSYFINFTVDLTSPNVTINLGTANNPTIQYGSNFTATTNNRTFNTSVFDGLTLVDTVYFWFDNATGNDFNVTGINNSGQWSVSYNVSSLYGGNGDITQTVRVMANDTLNNLNNSVFWNFTVDRTNPVVTASSSGVTSTAATLTATINESVNNCTYSVTNGAGSGTMTKSSSTSFTATLVLLPSTDYVATLNCYDFVNNNGLSTTSFTSSAAAAASTGGSGSGGSSGGISTSVQGSFEKKVWTSINAGETASVALKNGVMGVTEVSFSVPATVYGAWVNVAKKDSLPSSVSSFSGKVYRNLEISKGPALNKEGAYTDATVKFKVEKAWLAEKQLTKEAVALHHYDGSKWVELSTSVGEDDGTYVHYSAKTPSFSYFVIGEKSGAQAAPAVEQPVVEAPTEQPVVEAPAEAPAVAEKKGMSTGLLVALLAVAVVVVAAVVYMRKRR